MGFTTEDAEYIATRTHFDPFDKTGYRSSEGHVLDACLAFWEVGDKVICRSAKYGWEFEVDMGPYQEHIHDCVFGLKEMVRIREWQRIRRQHNTPRRAAAVEGEWRRRRRELKRSKTKIVQAP